VGNGSVCLLPYDEPLPCVPENSEGKSRSCHAPRGWPLHAAVQPQSHAKGDKGVKSFVDSQTEDLRVRLATVAFLRSIHLTE
jgi:hypothetical protein